MNIKIVLAVVMVLAVFWLIFSNPNDFLAQANQAAEQAVEEARDITSEICGIEDDYNRQEARQEYILEEVRKK